MEEQPNFTEDAVSIAIAMQLALLSFPRFQFSIVPISRKKERWLGADARLFGNARFMPFYMQFKRPFAHVEPSKSKIVKDRRSFKPPLSTSPRTLYFKLQDKQAHHKDFQHNVLLRLRKKLKARGIGDAVYVCPLFLDRQTYLLQSHWAGLRRWTRHWPARPYDRQSVIVRTTTGAVSFSDVPVLSEHISVPPHVTVSTAKHRYSFTERGDELCFHSPESLPEGSQLFSGLVADLIERTLPGEGLLSSENSAGFLRELVSDVVGPDPERLMPSLDRSPMGGWYAWGDFLQTNFGIEQYAMVLTEP